MPGAIPPASPAADTPAAARYSFVTIGVPASPDAQASGINNVGLVAGSYEDSSAVTHGFIWTAGAFQTVDYPGAAYTYLELANSQGVAIGYYGDGNSTEHAVMYWNGTWTALPDIPGYSENEGYGINASGEAVGNAYQGTTSVAWVWHPGTSAYSFFTEPEAAQYGTYTSGITDKGQVVGPFQDPSGVWHGFLKDGDTYTTFDVPGASYTYPLGINNSGTIVVGEWNANGGPLQGFLLTKGSFTILDYPGPAPTAIEGVNDRGDISGAYADRNGATKAFVAYRR